MIMRRAIAIGLGALLLAACAPVAAPAAEEAPVRITLSRSVCFGYCPAYSVSVTGDGAVTYEGHQHVHVRGVQRSTISREAVARLVERFDAIGFESLQDHYRSDVTDLPTYTLVLERSGRRKVVEDYSGLAAGMPRAVRDLQDEVDRVTGTARWVLRDGQPVRERPEP
jgi:hypothetical protein